ncbi:MAG: type II secretion system protein GspN [Bdellovibrionales bacterium]|nr:type II secretion system protein GspN [Bdellovibrionales bacterium]
MAQKLAQFIINIFKFHKKKLLSIVFFALVFFLILFPYEDLSDLVTENVALATNNQVFITFDDLNLSLIPAPGLDMKGVKLELPNLPPIEAQSLSLSPSIASLLAFKLGFVSNIKGLLDGDLQLVVKPGSKTEDKKIQLQAVDIEANNIQLSELKKYLNLPIQLKGKANLELNAELDPNFVEQPDGEASLMTEKLRLPSTSLPTPFGELPFPEMNFEKLTLKGRLTGGDLIIEQFELGSIKDAFSMRLKGRLGLQLIKGPRGIAPLPGAFDLKAEINSKSRDNKDLQLFLSFLDKYKVTSGDTDRYLLRVKGRNFQQNPDMSKLNKFD